MIERYNHKEIAPKWSDKARFEYWLEIEVAICEALAELGDIPDAAAKRIKKNVKIKLNRIRELEEITKHEVVAFVNSVLEQIGDDACYFHFGVTSSDVMDTAFSMILRDSLKLVIAEVSLLISEINQKAIAYKDLVCVGRTHGIQAEPLSFGLKFLSWYDELLRHKTRLTSAMEHAAICMVSGAVGTYSALPPKVEDIVAKKLDLKTIGLTTQVIPRDLYAEVFNSIALCGGCIERISIELRHLQRTEVMEVMEEFTKGQTGSSAMPHKRNPISAENLTGCARILRGYAGMALENIALWHERDISHSSVERVIGPDATSLLGYMLKRMTGIISRLKVVESGVTKNLNLSHGLIYSSIVLVELMRKGMKRDDAYEVVQSNAMKLWEIIEQTGQENINFAELLKKDERVIKLIDENGIDKLFDSEHALRNVDLIYKRVLAKE